MGSRGNEGGMGGDKGGYFGVVDGGWIKVTGLCFVIKLFGIEDFLSAICPPSSLCISHMFVVGIEKKHFQTDQTDRRKIQ